MDGYIKNKKEAIKSARKSIFAKYMLTAVIILLIPFWLLMLAAIEPYENWTQTEIRFSHISEEHINLDEGRSYVLNAEDGRKFVMSLKDVDLEELQDTLIPGGTYTVVFGNTVMGGKRMKALWNDSAVFQDLDDSIARWEREHKGLLLAVIVNIGMEIIAVILIDRLLCKREYERIKKLKADIQHREDRLRDK